MKWIQLTQK